MYNDGVEVWDIKEVGLVLRGYIVVKLLFIGIIYFFFFFDLEMKII